MPTVQDTLNAEIPDPSFSFWPRVNAPLPPEMTFSRADVDNPDPTARTLDPISQKFIAKGADQHRVYGAEQGLLVEAGKTTNHARNSSDVSVWPGGFGISSIGSGSTSYIKGFDSYLVRGSGQSENVNVNTPAGTFTGSNEIGYGIFEKKDAERCGLIVKNANASAVANIKMKWSDLSVTVDKGPVREVRAVELPTPPNGEKAAILAVTYGSGNSENVSGDPRQINLLPDANANGNATYLHHAQVSNKTAFSAPIETDSTATTRAADVVEVVRDSGWYNERGMSFLLEVTPHTFDTQGSALRVLNFSSTGAVDLRGQSPPYKVFYFNSSGGNIGISSIVPFYEKSKIVFSISRNEIIMGANGKTKRTTHGGQILTDMQGVKFGLNQVTAKYHALDTFTTPLTESQVQILSS